MQKRETALYGISASVFRRNLRFILKHSFEGSVTAFSRAAKMHHNSVSDVIFGIARPGLDSILRLAHAARVETVRLLGQPISRDDVLKGSIHAVICSFPRRTCRKYDWARVAKALRQEIENRDSFPNSLFSLCRTLELDSGYVAMRLRSSAEALVARHRRAVSKRRRDRENAESKNLRAMIQLCLAKGVWPSNRRLRTLVEAPGSLRNPQIERERRRAVAEVLGFLGRNG
jgi:hypothetical protein